MRSFTLPTPLIFLLLIFTLETGCQPNRNEAPADSTSRDASAPVSAGDMSEIALRIANEQSTPARIWSLPQSIAPFGVIFVSGINGGFEQPGDAIYDRFGKELSVSGIASIFVSYRDPGNLENSVEDVRAAASYLKERGVKHIGIAGWSFGGAVAINSAVRIPEIVTVTTFAAQSLDTEAAEFFTRQSLLVIHSKADENVPFYAAEQILEQVPATVRKESYFFEDANHLLDETAPELDPVFRNWLRSELIEKSHPT